MNTNYKFFEDHKILVVDDNPQMRDMASKALVELGFNADTITLAEDGKKALELANSSEQDFEFFIIDLVMPEMNGIDLIKELMKIEKYQKTPKLVLSSEADSNIILNAIAAGANNYMNKPVEKVTLANKMFEATSK